MDVVSYPILDLGDGVEEATEASRFAWEASTDRALAAAAMAAVQGPPRLPVDDHRPQGVPGGLVGPPLGVGLEVGVSRGAGCGGWNEMFIYRNARR